MASPVASAPPPSATEDLPLDLDIWTEILDRLDAPDISHLARASKAASYLVDAVGWPSLMRRCRLRHVTVDVPTDEGSSMDVLRYNYGVVRSLRRRRMLARQVGQSWDKGYIPKLRISKDRILVAAGPKLIGYSLRPPSSPNEIRQKTVTSETIVWTPDIPSLKRRSIHQNDLTALRRRNVHVTAAARRGPAYSPLEDITGFYECPDGQVVTGNVGGVLQRQRFTLDPYTNGTAHVAQSTAIYQSPGVQQIVEVSGATCGTSTLVLSATKDGQASLFRADAPWLPPSTIDTQTRLWTAYLSPSAEYAAFGGSGGPAQALRIYPVTPTGILTPAKTHPSFRGTTHTRSAVYGLASPPADTSMPYTNNASALLLSAWYDSFARVYDLRTSFGEGKRPVLEMQDPWSHEALYCCDFVGDGQIVAGAARHGMVHIWDPRMVRSRQQGRSVARETDGVTVSDAQESAAFARHRGGWTAYTPGGSDSPVYDVKAEGGRIWGVTNRRTFVLAFDTSGPSARSPGARGWDIVPPYMAPRVSNGWSGRGGKREEGPRDYATCYEHGDRTLRPFYSLGADKESIGSLVNGRR